jgi:subtilisin family serine protease
MLGLACWLLAAGAIWAQRVPGRYIVELTTEPVTEHVARMGLRTGLKSAEAAAQRGRVQTQQSRARAALAAAQAQVLDSVDTVANALFVQVDDAQAASLAAMPGVKRVLPERQFKLVLDRAVGLHKVAEAWSEIGEDRAGAGIKIGIIDTGIDQTHPGFADDSLVMPEGFPKVNVASHVSYATNKVIVARSYVSLLPKRDPDQTPADHVGHGTALAMIAAGVRTAGPLATIQGVAPKAYLGSYKVFGTPGYNNSASDSAILKALDDAVADGMDVINLSLGDDFAPRLADDIDVDAVERAVRAGVIVVVAAGNNGPGLNTIGSPATAPSAITVGAMSNDRFFGTILDVAGLGSYGAIPASGTARTAPLTGELVDVKKLDGDGLGCKAFAAGSLSGKIALISRGNCTFETKLIYAQRAGAVGALIHTAFSGDRVFAMDPGQAVLTAEMISYDDGVAIRQALAEQGSLTATLSFDLGPQTTAGSRTTDFGASGPSVDLGIKPDLLAVGQDMYTATQSYDDYGSMYNASRFIAVDGTSFSTPFVAGTAALLKAARPGLTVDQYRSLLVNTAARVSQTYRGEDAVLQQTGGGMVDALAALHVSSTAYPVSLSLGTGGADAKFDRTLTVTNLGGEADQFTLGVETARGELAAAFENTTVDLEAGAALDVPVAFTGTALTPGAYAGTLTITSAKTGTVTRVPYWYAASGAASGFTVLYNVGSARRNSVQYDVVLFRVLDPSGVALADVTPQVSVVSGGGSVRGVTNYDADVPGVFGIDVRLGLFAGNNVFRITVGDAKIDVTITGN